MKSAETKSIDHLRRARDEADATAREHMLKVAEQLNLAERLERLIQERERQN
jgi:hypothetical protein